MKKKFNFTSSKRFIGKSGKNFFIILIILILTNTAFCKDAFKPWRAGVKVGDEYIRSVTIKTLKKRKAGINKQREYIFAAGKIDVFSKKKNRGTRVFNGLQGGAYFFIRFFQVVISPQDGPNCRFYPTCSRYGREAIEHYGALFGAMLAGDRIIRCNPYSQPGRDRVPLKITGK
ncbi:membrane protein insertion efficiency factor YidD [Spirochaetota bacterium]